MGNAFGRAYLDYYIHNQESDTHPVIIESENGFYQTIHPREAFQPPSKLDDEYCDALGMLKDPNWVLDVGEVSLGKSRIFFPEAEVTNVSQDELVSSVAETKGLESAVTDEYASLPFQKQMFDAIIANSDAFPSSNISDTVDVLNELYRVTRRGGRALVEFLPSNESGDRITVKVSYKDVLDSAEIRRFTRTEFESVIAQTDWDVYALIPNGTKMYAILKKSGSSV